MEKRENSSVLRSKAIVYGQIAEWLSSAENYDVFRDSLDIELLKSDKERGLFQILVERKSKSTLDARRRDVVEEYIQDVILNSGEKTLKTIDAKLVFDIRKETNEVAKAWVKNPFIFEDCAGAKPEQIATYVDLIDKNLDLESYEYPHLVVGYKKMMRNQRHDAYLAGETNILVSDRFAIRTGEKASTPNWNMENHKDCLEYESYDFGEM